MTAQAILSDLVVEEQQGIYLWGILCNFQPGSLLERESCSNWSYLTGLCIYNTGFTPVFYKCDKDTIGHKWNVKAPKWSTLTELEKMIFLRGIFDGADLENVYHAPDSHGFVFSLNLLDLLLNKTDRQDLEKFLVQKFRLTPGDIVQGNLIRGYDCSVEVYGDTVYNPSFPVTLPLCWTVLYNMKKVSKLTDQVVLDISRSKKWLITDPYLNYNASLVAKVYIHTQLYSR